MKFNSEELSILAEDSENLIKDAIENLGGAKEYESVVEILEEALEELKEISLPIKEEYSKQTREELKYQEFEYRREVF